MVSFVHFAAGVATVLLLASTGCKPKVGKSCNPEGKEVCASKNVALLCLDGKWTQMPCRGSKGCDAEGGMAECDQGVARTAETCHLEGGITCTEDKRASLICKNNAWALDEACGGPQACSRTGQTTVCDSSVARENDKCSRPDSQACSQDKRARIACNGNKFVLAEYCRGPEACKSTSRRVVCDNSLAVIGELCDIPDNYACSTDFRSILKCVKGKYELDQKCKMTTSCHVEGTKVGCFE